MRATSLEELRMIVAIESAGSLTGAADALGITQQAVSQRMRQVERRWGLALFERGARGTGLTAHGVLVAQWAATALDHAAAFDRAVDSLRSDRMARLRVAASLTIAEHLVPGWLVTYARMPAAAHVELTAVNSVAVVERLRSGADDIGFIETPDLPPDLHTVPLGFDEIGIVVGPAHAWARRAAVGPQEVASTALVGREVGSGTRLTLERALLGIDGIDEVASPAAELASTTGIRATLAAGGGVGALSLRAVREDLEAGRLVRVPVAMPPVTRPLTAVFRKDVALTAAAKDLLGIASSAVPR